MKQKGLMKKLSAVLLATAMTVSTFPQLSTSVYAADRANKLPTMEQFATVEQLKSFNTNDNDGAKNPAKVYFGDNNQQWWIVGSQQEQGLTLFAASPLVTNQQFEPIKDTNKTYLDSWNCDYSITGFSTPNEVYSNHYGGSELRKNLQKLERSFFSDIEQTLMNETTILTEDEKNKSIYATTDKLYLPAGYFKKDYITAGGNKGLRIDNNYWIKNRAWLRTPEIDGSKWGSSQAVTWYDGPFVTTSTVDIEEDVVPVFELNLSSVIFTSAVPAASSTGNLSLQDTDGDGAFTLRYKSDSLGSALVSYDKNKVTLTDVPSGTYLVVQNHEGAKAKQITNETEISASAMNLDSFANCKVWLEATKTENRITYATLADEVIIDLEVSDDFRFETQHAGYTDISAKTFIIKNTSNVDVTNINATLMGTNADAFTLDTTGMQTSLVPNGTTTFAVKPNTDLGVGIYTAQVKITGETGISKSFEVNYIVEGHEYESIVIPPTCTSKGYTTHTCKKCPHSYIDSETDMLPHEYKEEWGKDETSHWHECECGAKADEDTHTFKWVVDKEATHMVKGSKHEECSICGYKKASVEIPVLTPTNPDKPKTDKPNNDKGSVETGNQINVGLFTSLSMISAFGIAVLVVLKKKKALENK